MTAPQRNWRLLLPAAFAFVLFCLVAPLAGGLAIRAGGTAPAAGALAAANETRLAWVGIRMRPLTAEIARALRLPDSNGVIVDLVYPKSPAEAGGLEPFDIIVAVNGQPVLGIDNLGDRLRSFSIGERVTLNVLRADARGNVERAVVTIVIGTRPRIDAPVTLTSYQQQGVPFRIRYPDTWAVDDQDAPDGPVVFSAPSQYNDFVQVQLAFRAPQLAEWYRQVLDGAGQDARDFRILSETDVTVNNQPGRRAEFRFTTQAGREQRVVLVMTRSPQGVGAVIALSADSTSYQALVRVFDEMVRSFTLLP